MKKPLLTAIAVAALLVWRDNAAAGEKPVQIVRDGLTLNGALSLPAGKTIKDRMVLITHGSLGHNGMEVMKAMQAGLAGGGVGSLAITLGLGVDNRRGMYDCATPHRHQHTDGLDEIGAWLNWLKEQGAGKIALMGHSRGGNQTAWFAAERPDPTVDKIVLLAPMTWREDREREQYRAKYGKPLEEALVMAAEMIKSGNGSESMNGVDFLYCSAATVTAASFISYYQPDPRLDTPTLLSRIAAPALVVAAGADQTVKGLPEAVQPLVAAGKVRLAIIADADHTFQDLAADDAVEAILSFLAD